MSYDTSSLTPVVRPVLDKIKPNFICAKCKEGFHNLGSLAIHEETIHEVPFTKTMRGSLTETVGPPYPSSGGRIDNDVQDGPYPALDAPRQKVVYISGPYRAATENGVYENIQRARVAAMKYWKLGYAVICPHLNTAFMGELGGSPEDDQEILINGDLEFVRRSDIIVMLPRWADSDGARQELMEARRRGKEVVWESL